MNGNILRAVEHSARRPPRLRPPRPQSTHDPSTGFIALMLPTLTNTNFAAVAHGLTDALRPVVGLMGSAIGGRVLDLAADRTK